MEFNIKNIEVRDPMSLYRELDKFVRFGDDHVTIKAEKDGVQGFYLGGLLLKDIKKSSVSSETINSLYSAIRSSDIRHAVLPNDVRKGQIPLILDDHSRVYIKNNLNELIEYGNVSWRMFFIPIKEDMGDTELFDAEIILEDSDDDYSYVSLTYDKIEDYYNKIIDESSEDIDLSYLVNSKSNNKKETTKSSESEATTNNELDSEIDDLNFGDDELDEKETDNSPIIESETTEIDQSTNELEITDEQNSEEQSSSLSVEEYQEEVSEDDNIVPSEYNRMTNEFTMIPQELESVLSSFSLRRFEEFEQTEESDTTHVILQKEIKNANQILSEHEQNIIRKAKQLYFQYMDQSYSKINQIIDVEQGDEIVKNKHNEALEKKNELDNALTKNVEAHEQKLEDKFWNEDFNIYKDQVLAGLKLQFEKAEYYNLVAEPLERYKDTEKNRIEEEKYEVTHELSNWFDTIKNKAIMGDRNNAIIEVQKYLDTSMKKVQSHIQELDNKMSNQNERFIKYEYGKKAEERLRNTVGSDLYSDEQAKKYKKQYELTESQKEELTNQLKDLEEKYKTDIESKDEENSNFKEEIEKNHKQILDTKDKELQDANQNLSELQKEHEENKTQLEQTQKKHRKKVLGTGIGSAVLAAVIFGGTAIGIYEHSQGVEDELNSQSKIVEQQKAEASKNENELKELKEQKAEEHDKQQKIIDKQKKELEDKKKKEDKKDKKD